ncbi:MAG: eukaryotic-like serine/threonine-protein kinase [Actinomycetota bacterium]|jgi:serine/threonine-protein kinase|nr:eukaryotic-like serine/threonine-protein kinase [Actinomycetota bacterium]
MARLMVDLVGEVFSDRYSLVSRIAGGGMGDVYRAHDLLLDRPVAVKVLQPSLAADPDFVARFRAEARAAARLTHPNVVGVYDWGSAGELTYYMVMEYVPGKDLREVLAARGPLHPPQAVQVMAAVCDALEAAHSGGLVHRDVKPENILIERTGRVKVADFGIALALDADRTLPGGVISGTLRYLSPEQAEGEQATPASDIWAAGAVLCELLTGRQPYAGSPADLLRRRAVEPPELPSEIDPELGDRADDVVLRACAVDPADRFATAGDMAEALRATAGAWSEASPLRMLVDQDDADIHLPETASTPIVDLRERARRPGRSWAWKIAGLALVLLALGVGAFKLHQQLTKPTFVAVPRVVGVSTSKAMRTAAAAGLHAFISGSEPDYSIPKGDVVTQLPEGGKLLEGSRVRLIVSSGLPRFKVPTVQGGRLDGARSLLATVGMTVGTITHRYSDQPPGTVMAQRPSSGVLAWGSSVDLVLSRGPKPTSIPQVTGLTEAKAVRQLKAGGFKVTKTVEFSDSVAKGTVIGTAPASTTMAPAGSAVDLMISKGPRYKLVTVPDVRTMSIASARNRLEALGLLVQVVQSCGGHGTIVQETDPIPGSVVRQNTQVALFVC